MLAIDNKLFVLRIVCSFSQCRKFSDACKKGAIAHIKYILIPC